MPIAKGSKKALPSTPISQGPVKEIAHMRALAWLAVAAVAISSGVITYSASAANDKQPLKRVDPMAVIMREINNLREQNNRIEEAVNRIERSLGSRDGGEEMSLDDMMQDGNREKPFIDDGRQKQQEEEMKRRQKEEEMRKQQQEEDMQRRQKEEEMNKKPPMREVPPPPREMPPQEKPSTQEVKQ